MHKASLPDKNELSPSVRGNFKAIRPTPPIAKGARGEEENRFDAAARESHCCRVERRKALITGINGFVGTHLANHLRAQSYEVFGIDLTPGPAIFSADILNLSELKTTLHQVNPDHIYHLAGSAFVPDADANPTSVYNINVIGTLNILEAARTLPNNPRILIVTSGEVYGAVPKSSLPITESHPLNPLSHYGVTKACADLIAAQYARRMDVIRVRPFNHIGPGQSPQFVCSSFAKQIVEIELGLRPPTLHVGNLEALRDFTDVRDVARAYRTIMEKAPSASLYNVGSGRAWKIKDLLHLLISKSGLSNITLQPQHDRLRPNDLPILLADNTKLTQDLAWTPHISMEQTLGDLLNHWKDVLQEPDFTGVQNKCNVIL